MGAQRPSAAEGENGWLHELYMWVDKKHRTAYQVTVSITKITSENPYVNMPEVYAAPPDYAFPRNFKGYGEKGLEGLKWPNDAKIAVSFVINYEEVSRAASADRISSRH